MSRRKNKRQLREVRQGLADAAAPVEDGDRPFDYAERASEIRERRRVLGEAARLVRRDQRAWVYGEDHAKAAAQYRRALEGVYPPGFEEAVQSLHSGDLKGLPLTLAFLEADPYFYGSGYQKERVLTRIKQLPAVLPEQDTDRLRAIVLAQVDSEYWRREFAYYARLAPRLDTPEFRAALYDRMNPAAHPLTVRLRARRVLAELDPAVRKMIGKPFIAS